MAKLTERKQCIKLVETLREKEHFKTGSLKRSCSLRWPVHYWRGRGNGCTVHNQSETGDWIKDLDDDPSNTVHTTTIVQKNQICNLLLCLQRHDLILCAIEPRRLYRGGCVCTRIRTRTHWCSSNLECKMAARTDRDLRSARAMQGSVSSFNFNQI